MKTTEDIHAEQCYWTIVANCSLPIFIFILYRLIKSIIRDWRGY